MGCHTGFTVGISTQRIINATSISVCGRIASRALCDDVRQVRVDDVVAPDAGQRSRQLIGRRRGVVMATLS